VRYEERGQGYRDVEKVGKHCTNVLPSQTTSLNKHFSPDLDIRAVLLMQEFAVLRRTSTTVSNVGAIINAPKIRQHSEYQHSALHDKPLRTTQYERVNTGHKVFALQYQTELFITGLASYAQYKL
jgi:hypothetical protein